MPPFAALVPDAAVLSAHDDVEMFGQAASSGSEVVIPPSDVHALNEPVLCRSQTASS